MLTIERLEFPIITQDIDPMPAQNTGPTLGRRWVNDTLTQCWLNVGPSSATLGKHWANIGSGYSPANMRRWPNIALLLGRRRRRWANGKTMLDQLLMVAVSKPITLISARYMWPMLLCKTKRQYLLTSQASSYCHLALQGGVATQLGTLFTKHDRIGIQTTRYGDLSQ